MAAVTTMTIPRTSRTGCPLIASPTAVLYRIFRSPGKYCAFIAFTVHVYRQAVLKDHLKSMGYKPVWGNNRQGAGN